MSLELYIQRLKRLVAGLEDNKGLQTRINLPAVKAVEAEYKDRIFKDGKASDGSNIGQYSTVPMYVSKTSNSLIGVPKGGFNPLGKNRKSTFKNGKKKKSRYLPGGYKEFRSRAGRQNQKVDLNLTGTSAQTIQTGTKGDSIVLGFTDLSRLEILEGNEDRFGKDIFTLSQEEEDLYFEAVGDELTEVIKEILK